ncbi:NAC domain-containing 8 isoform X1 [Olea europaea subsp. europaea]|uniref:NAC domain-containing 8 isoform X1 n=1 Tax=Olea europaea subsp. europaea TaxID=158383 RepID=A0A8S0TEW7_OLEEU|nr:NAC domain-containing 8 isoform X1 [Olea europaea subsp. europaea]
MASTSWLVDSNRIATKIRSASGACDPENVNWKSNPTKACPNCQYVIDNSDVVKEWPGLPRGVKFDPSDQEIIFHLLAKVGVGNSKPHPFINEFIPIVDEDDGICYTHPQNLPGVKQDGSVSHFFHRAIKAYNTGTRKRRKVHGDNFGDVRWHKTGRTKPVLLDGVQKGCKKIMVLYASPIRGGKPEKTNWVMHQYHLGIAEDESNREYVISKVFYQQQQQHIKESEKNEEVGEGVDAMIAKVDPITPMSVTPEPHISEVFYQQQPVKESEKNEEVPQGVDTMIANVDPVAPMPVSPKTHHIERRFYYCETAFKSVGPSDQHHDLGYMEGEVEVPFEQSNDEDYNNSENHTGEVEDKNDDEAADGSKCWESESQYLLDSQQLVEGLSLCDEFLQSQSPNRDVQEKNQELNCKPRLSDYARLGPEDFKKDLAECQDLVLDPANIELDTPPDFRLSQLEFGSQESYIAWGGSITGSR